MQPSPNGRRVGIRIVTFEACSGFTRVTARRIAQPPKVTFVTRLRSHQLPSETARQLPDLSTIIRVEPSSTDDSRLQGALPLMDIIDIVLSAKPMAVSFPAANARHEHEWKIWREVKLPAGKAIVPGVIDSTVNTVEHPEVVADRILNFANVVGRENVIAGVDCGFGTFAGRVQVDTKIVWLKLQSLAEGARLASAQLWAKTA